ncbi:hypothetical protein FO507_00970 [Bacillus mojavensis]|uniref:hypothetical protein n=1 Tax=Bacillus mojavensis TaxID=72360 RepID=UPI0002896189|nr:hypothetical protein [Bacillus mojavensis]MDR4225956.1 hypothetical protein [Bacillus mojavensis]MEC3588636.1 hypothetical protein [Bacillus mojavensis]MEC5244622.1 hypothetical protein [Bacillus mojavensis]MED0748686.1 hypothetical protein [Bacillus mojavensis]
MKKFSKMVINKGDEVIGEGYYERYDDELIVEASDFNIQRVFEDLSNQDVILTNIKFEDTDGSCVSLNGQYFIRSIRGEKITLQK